MNELNVKLNKISSLLAEHRADAMLLNRVSSFAWITCGAASYINTASTEGTASVLITPNGRYIITNNIEAPRLEREENLIEQGWEFKVSPWHSSSTYVSDLTRGIRIAADGPVSDGIDLSAQVSRLRANLLPVEIARFKILGSLCAQAMDEAIHKVRPGQSEYEIAGLLAGAAESRGVQAIVNLIATDERIFSFRHPLPTSKKMQKYAMLVLCGRKAGLVCSITRLVHFGKLSNELRKKQDAVARVDATFIANTRPGRTLGEIFKTAIEAYTNNGFPDEWKLHHQGGPAAYEPREFVATPDMQDLVSPGQVYAWNPSITGTKSEDTILVAEKNNEVISEIQDWPQITVEINGQQIKRPVILEVL